MLQYILIILVILLTVYILALNRFNKKKNHDADDFNKLMTVWHDYSTKYNIDYSIAYGTLLGHFRNKTYIPYDNDIDVWIGKKDIQKFLDMDEASRTDEKHEVYNGCKLVIYKDHDKPMRNRKRWDKTGRLVDKRVDPFSFNGPIGRLIYKDKKFIDIFVFHETSKEQVDQLIKEGWIVEKYGSLGGYNSSRCATDIPETTTTKINNVTTKVFKDKNVVIKYLYNIYGIFFRIPHNLL